MILSHRRRTELQFPLNFVYPNRLALFEDEPVDSERGTPQDGIVFARSGRLIPLSLIFEFPRIIILNLVSPLLAVA